MRKHAYIPDTQVKPGVKTDHILAAGRYLGEHLSEGDLLMLAGDWYDMASLSFYDNPGDAGWEEKDTQDDFDSGRYALDIFRTGFEETNFGLWGQLDKRVTIGNHEDRARRVRESALYRRFSKSLADKNFAFKELGIKTYPFLKYCTVDGITYSHYFCNPKSKLTNPIGGTVQNRLNKLMVSHTMGHQQGLDIGMTYNALGQRIRGLAAGSFYQHDEEYMGPQKNKQHWRGILIKHEVHRGDYDLMEVSMNYLLRNYL